MYIAELVVTTWIDSPNCVASHYYGKLVRFGTVFGGMEITHKLTTIKAVKDMNKSLTRVGRKPSYRLGDVTESFLDLDELIECGIITFRNSDVVKYDNPVHHILLYRPIHFTSECYKILSASAAGVSSATVRELNSIFAECESSDGTDPIVAKLWRARFSELVNSDVF